MTRIDVAAGGACPSVLAIRLREAVDADVRTIAECVTAAYSPWIERIGTVPGPMGDDYAARVREGALTIAEIDGRLAGLVVLFASGHEIVVDNVAVHPAWQGRGVGRALLLHAESVARRRSVRSIRLYTHEKMTENLDLYRRIGYVEYARRHEHGFDRVHLRKTLSDAEAGPR